MCTIKAGLGDVGEECMSDDQAFVLLHCIAKLESAANSDSLPQVTGDIRKDILECIQHGILTTSERIKRIWVEWSINRSSPGSGGHREFSLMMPGSIIVVRSLKYIINEYASAYVGLEGLEPENMGYMVLRINGNILSDDTLISDEDCDDSDRRIIVTYEPDIDCQSDLHYLLAL